MKSAHHIHYTLTAPRDGLQDSNLPHDDPLAHDGAIPIAFSEPVPVDRLKIEVWNESSALRSLEQEDGQWSYKMPPERRYLITDYEASERDREAHFRFDLDIGSQTVSRQMNIPNGHDILVQLRVYQKLPLLSTHRVPGVTRWKWLRIGDAAITHRHLTERATLQMFVPRDAYFAKKAGLQLKYITLTYMKHQMRTTALNPKIVPEKEIVAICRNIVAPERESAQFARERLSLPTGIVGLSDIKTLCYSPITNAVPGIDRLHDEDFEFGTSIQSPFYVWGRSRERTKNGILYISKTTPPLVNEQWLECAAEEAARVRGLDLHNLQAAALMIQKGSSDGNQASVLAVMRLLVDVVQMHCTTRNYVPDRNNFFGRMYANTDVFSSALAGPGDCEDSTQAIYQIFCHILFYPWPSGSVAAALRTVAAAMGVPCAIYGLCGPPMRVRTHGEIDELSAVPSGHVYLSVIPFPVFVEAMCADREQRARALASFKALFGFDAPEWHSTPAIIDGTFYCTPFYGENVESENDFTGRVNAVERWLDSKHEDRVRWTHYAFHWAMGGRLQGPNFAMRLFTEAHHFILPLGSVSYIRKLPSVQARGNINNECRAFMLYQADDDLGSHWPYWNSIGARKGYGIAIQQLSRDRTVFHTGDPRAKRRGAFELHPLSDPAEKYIEADRRLFERMQRPVLQLTAEKFDHFADDPLWRKGYLNVENANKIIPSSRSRRLRIFLYDLKYRDTWPKEMHELRKQLGASDWTVHSFGWAIAIVFIFGDGNKRN